MSVHNEKEGWSVTAPKYSASVGRMSFLAAERLISMATELKPITSESQILDNGAGTGAVSLTLASNFPEAQILATDTSAGMLDLIPTKETPSITTKVLDARSLSSELVASSYSHVFSTFMVQFLLTPKDAVQEMKKVLVPGGVIGMAIWGRKVDPYEIWDRACQSVDPTCTTHPPFDDPHAWRTREELEEVFGELGFADIRTEEITLPFGFDSPEAYLDFWFGAKNPGATLSISYWKGDLAPVKEAIRRIVRDEYDNGKGITIQGTLGVAKK